MQMVIENQFVMHSVICNAGKPQDSVTGTVRCTAICMPAVSKADGPILHSYYSSSIMPRIFCTAASDFGPTQNTLSQSWHCQKRLTCLKTLASTTCCISACSTRLMAAELHCEQRDSSFFLSTLHRHMSFSVQTLHHEAANGGRNIGKAPPDPKALLDILELLFCIITS